MRNRADHRAPPPGVSRARPKCSSAFPADRHGLRPETISRSACPLRAAATPRLQARRSFFKSLLRVEIALGIVRTRLHIRQPHPVQQLADGALVKFYLEALGYLTAQINAAPAHHAVPRRIRPGQIISVWPFARSSRWAGALRAGHRLAVRSLRHCSDVSSLAAFDDPCHSTAPHPSVTSSSNT